MNEGLLGVVIGGILVTATSVLVEIIRRSNESALDRQKRLDDRLLGSDAFQREALLGLQAALKHLLWMTDQLYAHLNTASEAEPGTAWRLIALPAEMNAEDHSARLDLILFKSRVADEDVRKLADAFADESYAVGQAEGVDGAVEARSRALDLAEELMNQSGALIRETFDIARR
jgi:hypothetical protein